MKIPKDVRVLGAVMTICVLILSLGLLHQRKTEIDKKNILEAQNYVSQVRLGTSALSIQRWLQERRFTFVREENNASNPFRGQMFTDANVPSRNVVFYLMAWSDAEPQSIHKPRHTFVFYFDHRKALVKAIILKMESRGMDF